MIKWFEELNTIQQIYSLIAIPSTLILLIQTVLLLFGIGDGDADTDGDFSGDTGGDGLTLFTVRGIMAFLCIGGWTGIFFSSIGLNSAIVVILSFACGSAALVGMAYMIKGLLKMQSSGNIDLANAIGKVGQAYIPIPGEAKGTGKVNIIVQGTYSEINAITRETETIKTGETVRVVATDETGLLVVERVANTVSRV